MATTGPTRPTRWTPVLALLVLAPWFAEMSWGGIPFTDLPLVLLFLAPMYGAAAVLIREVARRTGRGWPTIVLLGAAFGVFQAGIVDQSLFNPAYGRYDFQHPAHLDGIDVSLYYLLAFVTGHVVASMAAPIVVAESWSRRGSEPWLSRRATWVLAVVYVLASGLNHVGVKEEEGGGFQARPTQTLVAVAVVAVLVAVALCWRSRPSRSTRVPPPWALAVLGLVGYALYLPGEGAAAAYVGVVLVTGLALVVGRWSRSDRWRTRHTVALVLGAVATGVVLPFWSEPYDPSVGAGRELLDDVVAATVCLALVTATLWRRRLLLGEERRTDSGMIRA